MERLGHIHFRLVGHDRGARVAYRLALDHPGCIERLALLDIEPTIEVWRQIEAQIHVAVHWPWLARPQPEPENEIAAHADEYFEGLMAKWSKAKSLASFDRRALAHYRAAWSDPLHIHAFCEDYRAGASIDRDADEDSLATKTRIGCPVSVLWGSGFLPRAGNESVLDVWRRTFAPRAEGQMIEAGHFIAEENPTATAAALLSFL
jgi:haloacetate dehalogenase